MIEQLSLFWAPLLFDVVAVVAFYSLPPLRAFFAGVLFLIFSAVYFLQTKIGALWEYQALSLLFLHALVLVCLLVLLEKYLESQHYLLDSEDDHKEKLFLQKKELHKKLKESVENSRIKIKHTLRIYGAMKGLGEALTWEEMIPHMDYALQQCLGLKEYHLYLKEEGNLKKILSRGFRLADMPIELMQLRARVLSSSVNSKDDILQIPIYHAEEIIGVVWAKVPPVFQNDAQKCLLEIEQFSDSLAMGLEKARLFSSIEKLSRVDGLTGVYRRQIFNEQIQTEIRRARSFQTPFSILICDLDHFKSINDTYGHPSGDEVLRRVGRILKENIYETDFVARYGGEEFVVLFPQADPDGADRKAEILREKIAAEIFDWGLSGQMHISASFGVAHFPLNGTDATSLLAAADAALYQAKSRGRNCVVDARGS